MFASIFGNHLCNARSLISSWAQSRAPPQLSGEPLPSSAETRGYTYLPWIPLVFEYSTGATDEPSSPVKRQQCVAVRAGQSLSHVSPLIWARNKQAPRLGSTTPNPRHSRGHHQQLPGTKRAREVCAGVPTRWPDGVLYTLQIADCNARGGCLFIINTNSTILSFSVFLCVLRLKYGSLAKARPTSGNIHVCWTVGTPRFWAQLHSSTRYAWAV